MKKIITLLLALVVILGLAACGAKDIGLPVYNGIAYEKDKEHDNRYNIPGIVGEDFDGYIALLKENGFVFESEAFATEREAMDMDYWEGSNGEMHISVFLMFSIKDGSQHLEVNIVK